MIDLNRSSANQIDIEFDGDISPEEMEVVLTDFIAMAKEIQSGKLLYKIQDFELPSLKAIGVKLMHLPQLFGTISSFNKAAVVTDKKWLQNVAEFEGMLIPGFEIKAFDSVEIEAAQAWLDID
jgi:hypothetical protein